MKRKLGGGGGPPNPFAGGMGKPPPNPFGGGNPFAGLCDL